MLLREAWREGTRIRRRTLANLSKAPPELVAGIRALVKGGVVVSGIDQVLNIRRSLPHGHVAAVLGMARALGLERILARRSGRMRSLAMAAAICRLVAPGSKLACARRVLCSAACSSLGALLDFGEVRRLAQEDPPAFAPAQLERDAVAEASSPRFPHERLLVCFNPRVGDERRRKREALLTETEAILKQIAGMATGPSFRDRALRRIGRQANRFRMEKRFDIEGTNHAMTWRRRPERIAQESRLDGVCVVRTSLADIAPERAVQASRSLSQVERAFRAMKTDRLRALPMFVHTEEHVRGHVFLCMLAWHLEWHMRRRLAPMLFEDEDRPGAQAKRDSAVGTAQVSDRARRKATSKTTLEGLPVHSMPTLLDDLGTLTLNEVELRSHPGVTFARTSDPIPLQQQAFKLLDPRLPEPVAMQLTGLIPQQTLSDRGRAPNRAGEVPSSKTPCKFNRSSKIRAISQLAKGVASVLPKLPAIHSAIDVLPVRPKSDKKFVYVAFIQRPGDADAMSDLGMSLEKRREFLIPARKDGRFATHVRHSGARAISWTMLAFRQPPYLKGSPVLHDSARNGKGESV